MTTTETAIAIPERWTQEIQRFESQHFNILAPRELGEVPPFHTPHMSVIQVNPDKDGGEVYPLPGGRLGLSKIVLDKIAQAGSITWLPDKCGGAWITPRKYQYHVAGVVKGLDGQRRLITGHKEVDLDVYERELRASVPQRDKCPQKEPERSRWIDNTVRNEMITLEKHVSGRTESMAKNRAIRSAYGLKSAYSREELTKPFVIPRLVLTPDLSDPDVKRMVLADALGIIPELYGNVQAQPLPPALPPAPDDDEPNAPALPPPTNGTAAHAEAPAPPAEDPSLTDEAAFQEAYNGEEAATESITKAECIDKQRAAIRRVMARKGYEEAKLKAPLDQFTRKQRLAFWQHLADMPDVQAALPW